MNYRRPDYDAWPENWYFMGPPAGPPSARPKSRRPPWLADMIADGFDGGLWADLGPWIYSIPAFDLLVQFYDFIRKRDQYRCVICHAERGPKRKLNLHHRYYLGSRTPGDMPCRLSENGDALTTLCTRCHLGIAHQIGSAPVYTTYQDWMATPSESRCVLCNDPTTTPAISPAICVPCFCRCDEYQQKWGG